MATIGELGAQAMPLHSLGSAVLFAEKLYLSDESNPRIDIGRVGQITRVNAALLRALTAADYIPVIAPIALDTAGGKLNVNADTAAGFVAAACQAEKMVLVSDTHGIRANKDDPASLVRSVTRGDIEKLIAAGNIGEGMLPKVEACFIALDGGVQKTHIIDGRFPHALLLEIYSDRGVGTEIVRS